MVKFAFVKQINNWDIRYWVFPESERNDKKDKMKWVIWDIINDVTKERAKEIKKALETKDPKIIVSLIREELENVMLWKDGKKGNKQ